MTVKNQNQLWASYAISFAIFIRWKQQKNHVKPCLTLLGRYSVSLKTPTISRKDHSSTPPSIEEESAESQYTTDTSFPKSSWAAITAMKF